MSGNPSELEVPYKFTPLLSTPVYNFSNSRTGKGNIQDVPGGKDLISGECSLGQTIPI